MAVGFIAFHSPVAECRRTQVERHSHTIGRNIIHHRKIDIHKSRYCIGVGSVFIGQHFDTVKRAVHNAVSVNRKQLHSSPPVIIR